MGFAASQRRRDTDSYPVSGTATADPRATPPSFAVQRVGVTFINSSSYSVAQVYVERSSSEATYKSVAELDKNYNRAYFSAAWANFTGGWMETTRTTANDISVIDFTLSLSGNTYLARQLGTLDHGWIKGMRLVVPANNPALLNLCKRYYGRASIITRRKILSQSPGGR